MLDNETVKALIWFEKNQMKSNLDQFQCILHSKTPDPEFCISLCDTVIEPSDTVIDDKLTFHQHVKKMTTNAALKLNALPRQSKWLDPEVRHLSLVASSIAFWFGISVVGQTCWL